MEGSLLGAKPKAKTTGWCERVSESEYERESDGERKRVSTTAGIGASIPAPKRQRPNLQQ
jgi:hypothetical protein